MTTLTRLLTKLSKDYGASRRPERYFDVPKRGELTPQQVRLVKARFKELISRQSCVEASPDDPTCYEKTQSDRKSKNKRASSYKKDYESVYKVLQKTPYVNENVSWLKDEFGETIPLGVLKIAAVTGLPAEPLAAVFDIGVGAYASSGSRQGMSAEQWGYGRVYAFVMSYFHNGEDRYTRRRYLRNQTDRWVFDWISDILEGADH